MAELALQVAKLLRGWRHGFLEGVLVVFQAVDLSGAEIEMCDHFVIVRLRALPFLDLRDKKRTASNREQATPCDIPHGWVHAS